MRIITTPWIAIDLGSSRTHVAYIDSNGEVKNLVPENNEFDSVFHVSKNGNDIRVGQEALEQLESDPDGIVLLQTPQLKTDEPINFFDSRGTTLPSTLFAQQLRVIKKYCEAHLFESQPISSCVMSLPHRQNSLRNSYLRIAKEAGFSQVLFRDAVIAAAATWHRVWGENYSFVIVCHLAASQVSFSLLQCRYGGCERIKHVHSRNTVGVDEIDRIILLSQQSDSQIFTVEKGDDLLRLKAVRRKCHWDKNEDFRILWSGRFKRIRTEHFVAAMNIVAKNIQFEFKRYQKQAEKVAKQTNIPVVLIGGGANIPPLIEAVEKTAAGKVYWWGEAEEAVVMGTAMRLLPKTKPVNPNEEELHFYQLYQKAETGDSESQYYLGKSLELGRGTPISPDESLDWYRLSAQNGLPKAKHRLAMLPFHSLDTITEVSESMDFLRELATEGDANLQYLLGRFLYENSVGSVTEAEDWLRRAADQNVPDAIAYCEKFFT